MDERKSWKWIIAAYGGAVALIAAATIFIARGAGHGEQVLIHGYATATPTVADVYSGIRPDPESPWIHARIVKAVATPSPTPAPSGSPGAHPTLAPSPAAAAKAVAEVPKLVPHKIHTHAAQAGVAAQLANRTSANPYSVAPVEVEQVTATEAPAGAAPAPTQAPTQAPTAAPAPPVQVAANVPIYAPERIVDAQVRVAVQPDYPESDRDRGEKGTSVVLVTIDPKGNVVGATVGSSSGYPALDRAAVTAARSSQFIAPKINGHPATETYRVVYDFAP